MTSLKGELEDSEELYTSCEYSRQSPPANAINKMDSINLDVNESDGRADSENGRNSNTAYPNVVVLQHRDSSQRADQYMDIPSTSQQAVETPPLVFYPNNISELNSNASLSGSHQSHPFVNRSVDSRTTSLDGQVFGPRLRSNGSNNASYGREHAHLEHSFGDALSLNFVVVHRPENEFEAKRMANNHTFGFRKWKSHVTERPLSERSKIVKELYMDPLDIDNQSASCCTWFGNICYTVFFGWWVALIYGFVGCIMCMTIIGKDHGIFCFKLSSYFFWPFGKFLHKNLHTSDGSCSNLECVASRSNPSQSEGSGSEAFESDNPNERTPLNHRTGTNSSSYTSFSEIGRFQKIGRMLGHEQTKYWHHPATYIWLLLGCPLLLVIHTIVCILSFLTVVCVPVSKMNGKVIEKVLLLPPQLLHIDNSSFTSSQPCSDIIIYINQAANPFYYKYSIDGVNILVANCLIVVPIALGFGYGDRENFLLAEEAKFAIALVAVIPLSYCIGMGITSLSAQTNPAIGAVLNATFGSIVEIILYSTALIKGHKINPDAKCYEEMVKAGLVGTLMATTLLIPGISMVIGGLKHATQRFNARSAGVGATLLFVSVAGVFAPSVFTRSYSHLTCSDCHNSTLSNSSVDCVSCKYTDPGPGFYATISPLIHTCVSLMPVAYVIGLVFSLKTHRAHIYDTFKNEVRGHSHEAHHEVHWGKIKSVVVLLVCVVLMSLCADLVVENIQPLLHDTGVTVYVVGVTLLALIPDIPEIVVGIQFALQNNISLSIEVGSCIAVQVCMLQVPALILVNAIYPMGFRLLFSDVHIWSSLIGVFMMNYIYQDGKSDYFQGSAMVLAYFILIAMYFVIPVPDDLKC